MSGLSLWRWSMIVLWSLAVAASLVWNLHLIEQGRIAQARSQAVGLLEKDLSARALVAELGGVYARTDRGAIPNVYLRHVPDRDVTTNRGVALTLINASYFMRLVHDGEAQAPGDVPVSHITSLRPLRPTNRPDALSDISQSIYSAFP